MKKQVAVIAVLVFCLVTGTAVFAKSNIGLKGVGAKVGFVDPEGDIGSTIGFGGVVDLGTFAPNITFGGDVMYWGKSYTEHDFKFTYSQIYISATGRYMFNTGKKAKILPYAGAGLEFVIGKSKGEYTGELGEFMSDESWSHSDSEIGIHLVGGFKYPLDKSKYLFAEARYSMGGLDMLGVFGGIVFSMK